LLKYKNRDKMIFYSFWMTILIVVYHLAPHLIELSDFNGVGGYLRQYFETFGPIALNYFSLFLHINFLYLKNLVEIN
jgi:hypothetical protein